MRQAAYESIGSHAIFRRRIFRAVENCVKLVVFRGIKRKKQQTTERWPFNGDFKFNDLLRFF